jgi:hypothetical protein
VCHSTALTFAKLYRNSFSNTRLNGYGAMLGLYWVGGGGSAEVLDKIPIPVPLSTPQIPHGLR